MSTEDVIKRKNLKREVQNLFRRWCLDKLTAEDSWFPCPAGPWSWKERWAGARLRVWAEWVEMGGERRGKRLPLAVIAGISASRGQQVWLTVTGDSQMENEVEDSHYRWWEVIRNFEQTWRQQKFEIWSGNNLICWRWRSRKWDCSVQCSVHALH